MHDDELRLGIFCRKSAARAGKGKKELSVSAQESRGRKVATLIGAVVHEVWHEVGSASRFRSASKGRRTKQEKALRALVDGELDALWVYRLDRWDRQGAGAILRIIEPADGVPRRILFGWDESTGKPELDSSNPRDRSELIRRAEEAREETDRLSERVTDTKAHQRESGEWVGGRLPWGYEAVTLEVEDEDGDTYDIRKLRRKEELVPLIRFIFTDLAVRPGLSQRGAIRLLNAEYYENSQGREWTQATFRQVIRNPVYAGWQTVRPKNGAPLVYRNEKGEKLKIVEGETFVTDEEQQAAVAGISGPQYGSGGGTTARHLLSGLARCAACGAAASVVGRGHACGSKNTGKRCPDPAWILRDVAESYVAERWIDRMAALEPEDPLAAVVARRWAELSAPVATEDYGAAREALKTAETQLARVWGDRRAGLYDGPSEKFFRADLEEATAMVDRAQKSFSEARGDATVDVSFLMDPEQSRDAWASADLPLRRNLLRLAIRRVHFTRGHRGVPVNPKERIRIEWLDDPEP